MGNLVQVGSGLSLRDVVERNGRAHLLGCGRCQFGLIDAPVVVMGSDLWLVRLRQAVDKKLTFCECAAGVAYRKDLVRRYRVLVVGNDNDLIVDKRGRLRWASGSENRGSEKEYVPASLWSRLLSDEWPDAPAIVGDDVDVIEPDAALGFGVDPAIVNDEVFIDVSLDGVDAMSPDGDEFEWIAE